MTVIIMTFSVLHKVGCATQGTQRRTAQSSVMSHEKPHLHHRKVKAQSPSFFQLLLSTEKGLVLLKMLFC